MVGFPRNDLKRDKELQQQQQQQQQLSLFQSGLLVLVVLITSYIGFMQHDQAASINQLAVMQKELAVMQKEQAASIGMIDLKLNGILGGAGVALGIFAGLSTLTTTFKNSQDIAINNMKLEELKNNRNGTESKT